MTPTLEKKIANLQSAFVLLIAMLALVVFFFFYQLNKLNREVGEIKTRMEIQNRKGAER